MLHGIEPFSLTNTSRVKCLQLQNETWAGQGERWRQECSNCEHGQFVKWLTHWQLHSGWATLMLLQQMVMTGHKHTWLDLTCLSYVAQFSATQSFVSAITLVGPWRTAKCTSINNILLWHDTCCYCLSVMSVTSWSGFYWSKRQWVAVDTCKSAPRSRQIATPASHYSVLQAGCPSCRPTISVEALKAISCFSIVYW